MVSASPSPPPPIHPGVPGDRGSESKANGCSAHPQAYQNTGLAGDVLAFAALPARADGTSGVPEQQPHHHGQAAPQHAPHPGWGLTQGIQGAEGPKTVHKLWGKTRKIEKNHPFLVQEILY